MRRLSIFLGIVLVTIGGFGTYMLFGFADMMDPAIQGPTRQSEILSRVTSNGSFPVGLFIICVGIWLVLVKPKPAP